MVVYRGFVVMMGSDVRAIRFRYLSYIRHFPRSMY